MKITLRQHYSEVQLVIDGRLCAEIPWSQALQLADGLRSQGKRAEEWAKAEAIAQDQAILTRLGVPFGLSRHPIIRAEARKFAAFDRQLRRWIPWRRARGIQSGEDFGTPKISMRQPT